jgi:hypothetical protein
VTAGVLVLCLCAGFFAFYVLGVAGVAIARNVVTSPSEVADIASGIAEYTLPPGYDEEFGMRFLGFSLVAYATADEHSHLMLMQFPPTTRIDQIEMERQLREATRDRSRFWDTDMRTIERRQVAIRGQEVTLTVSEGTNHEGDVYRAISGVFQGKGGPTLLVMSEPRSQWDEAAVSAFIASIR